MKSDVPVLRASDLKKAYRQGERDLQVLNGVSLTVERGERLAILGLSGSGKSTLLHLLGGLDRADSGDITLLDTDLTRCSDQQLCELRNRHLGFVYQFHHLLADFSARENVAMPLLIRGNRRREALAAADELLNQVGLADRVDHRPGQLSGGERQRVAIARALVTEPACVLADEPTGNLDEKTADQINELMLTLSETLGISFVIVTHNHSLADSLDRRLLLHEGQLESGA